jgi:hypothetical protein
MQRLSEGVAQATISRLASPLPSAETRPPRPAPMTVQTIARPSSRNPFGDPKVCFGRTPGGFRPSQE